MTWNIFMSSDTFLYSFYIYKNENNTYINNSSNVIMKLINRDYLQKNLVKVFLKKKKKNGTILSWTIQKSTKRWKAKSCLVLEKKIIRSVKMLYYDYKTLFLKVVSQKMRLMKNRLKLNLTIYFEKAILKNKF